MNKGLYIEHTSYHKSVQNAMIKTPGYSNSII